MSQPAQEKPWPLTPADELTEQAWAHLDSLAKPRRSLGKLEHLAVRLARIQRTLRPTVRPRRLVLFAGDHGVVARGVSAWPSEVTALMVRTILMGRASSSALSAAHDCSLRLVDVGVAGARVHHGPDFFRDARIACGTQDLSAGPAMTSAEFDAAWQVGVEEAERAVADGNRVLIAGEMGIGNTTPAACLTMLFTDVAAEVAVGPGAGADDATLRTKREIVASALARAGGCAPLRTAIEGLAGLEIVAMAGFYAAGARVGATLLIDGYVATAAALIAWHLQPECMQSMIAAHRSAEPGHGAALACLGLEPLLDWNMRLGEGTGALVALPMLDSAAALMRDVAALSELGVARED
ncbi:MAG TPA: nicotinate-nucleotide--dimethylbenzimidazole phosphoribosyltransferase [Steroidobacteraceae bacterium]|nr:nicotinate-nucleotide--dimethylbenzimidazole phosphoribosyltransferase [Steroidobacteraceae bacterium]